MNSKSRSRSGPADRLNERPGYLLKRAAASAMADLSERLAAIDLRQVDASTLVLIDEKPGIIGSSIGKILDIRGANMVPLIRKLEDRDLIERTPIDGKSNGLHLTDKGKQVCREAEAILARFEQDLMARVPAEHREHLAPALLAIWRQS
ncbi:MarR family transcriptional regulator [Sphingobium sp. DEHP117]|uniref:MarR family winged helix-turn-helix transcriptional regulator n=1 Tax=Sphingobium sp. DEHP117 TaxID=2993436 RepID=UPI0027D54DC1|nr:MarR family transcriptional regulator [Sphingobium sp. DEHP117]MDQ4419312.1 MarR family transcriptional regulator [Sphingobium sp. DEHP117]